MLTWINAGCDVGLGLPKHQAMRPTSALGPNSLGQTEKNSLRANVFRVAPDSGLYSMQSALRICAKSRRERVQQMLTIDHLSARIRIDCENVRPSSFAAFLLITISNLVGCSTGRSPGLAPKIIST